MSYMEEHMGLMSGERLPGVIVPTPRTAPQQQQYSKPQQLAEVVDYKCQQHG